MTGDNRTVGICLMKSDEADATITHLLEVSPHIRVEDHVTYFRVMTETDLRIDLREVSAYLGRDLPMPSFLVTLSAYFGQIEADDSVLVISPVSPNSPTRGDGGCPPGNGGVSRQGQGGDGSGR